MKTPCLDFTDNFLSLSFKKIFEQTEKKYQEINILDTLNALEYNPIITRETDPSEFKSDVRLKVTLMLGVFFVAIPMLAFSVVSSLLSFDFSYVVLLTFGIALLATFRMDEIVKRYTQQRCMTSNTH